MSNDAASAMPNEIRIVCDQTPGHSQKRPTSLITVFQHIGSDNENDDNNGRWTTHVRSKRLQRSMTAQSGSVDPGRTLTGDEVFKIDVHGMRPAKGTRSVYQIECPTCSAYPVSAREETIFAILNKLRHAGIGSITLRALAARISGMS